MKAPGKAIPELARLAASAPDPAIAAWAAAERARLMDAVVRDRGAPEES